MAFTYITLTAGSGLRTATGDTAMLARIRATPLVDMVNGVEIVNQEVILPLNASGVATKTLAATTDASTTPTGNAYQFRLEVAGHTVRSFIAELPASPTTRDISTLTPLAGPPDLGPAGYTDEQAQDAAAALLTSGSHTGITATYVDASNRLDLAVTGGGGYTDEQAQDAAASMITAGSHTGLTATYVDASNRLDLAVTGGSTTVTHNTQTGTTYTLVLGDAGKVVEMNNAAANTLTVPPNSSVAFPTGTFLSVRQYGAGQTTIAAGSGVTLHSYSGALRLSGQYAEATLTKRGTNEWILSGETAV